MPRDSDTVRSEYVAIRMSPAELQETDARASSRQMSRSAYMIAAAIGTLDVDPTDTERRVDALERRLDRLEEIALGQ